MNQDPVRAFLDAVEGGAIGDTDFYAADAELDATCPNWRFQVNGPDAIRAEYSKWFADPAVFVDLERIPAGNGEFVSYELEWFEDGVRHRVHHAHRLVVAAGKIVRDTAWCGGRWPEPLLRQMAEASPGR